MQDILNLTALFSVCCEMFVINSDDQKHYIHSKYVLITLMQVCGSTQL